MSQEQEVAEEIKIDTIGDELSLLKADVFPNIEDGSLLVVTIGNNETPATKSDMERVSLTINETFEDVPGVRVLIVPHTFNIQALPLPTLRHIESQVVDSWNGEPAVVDIEDAINLFGGYE
jgi:hypothetical protein